MTPNDPTDPKGLMREAYRMPGISDAECRSILLDWALSLRDGQDHKAALTDLLAHYGAGDPNHPMNMLLREGLVARAPRPSRRKQAE